MSDLYDRISAYRYRELEPVDPEFERGCALVAIAFGGVMPTTEEAGSFIPDSAATFDCRGRLEAAGSLDSVESRAEFSIEHSVYGYSRMDEVFIEEIDVDEELRVILSFDDGTEYAWLVKGANRSNVSLLIKLGITFEEALDALTSRMIEHGLVESWEMPDLSFFLPR